MTAAQEVELWAHELFAGCKHFAAAISALCVDSVGQHSCMIVKMAARFAARVGEINVYTPYSTYLGRKVAQVAQIYGSSPTLVAIFNRWSLHMPRAGISVQHTACTRRAARRRVLARSTCAFFCAHFPLRASLAPCPLLRLHAASYRCPRSPPRAIDGPAGVLLRAWRTLPK